MNKYLLLTCFSLVSIVTKAQTPTISRIEAKSSYDSTLYIYPEVQPSFHSGLNGFQQYIRANMKYPKTAKTAGIKGRVIAQFVVETDGSLSNIEILRGLSSECDAEAIRLLKECKEFIPARDQDKPVRAVYTIPVNFGILF